MTKKSFVRVSICSKNYRLSRSDIVRTHFTRKRALPRLPPYALSSRIDSDLELENKAFYEVCCKREESSEDEWCEGVVSGRRRAEL